MTDSNTFHIRSLAEAANNISNPITEAKTSPKEHEWLSDMKGKDVAAISKLLKSKDTKALEQYLISNRLMGRDGLVQGKNLDRSAIEIIKRSFADVHEEVQVEEVETVEEGVLGNVAKKIIQKIKDIKSDYAEWRDLAKQLSQLKQERDSVLADIQVSAQKRLKELDTEMQKAALKAIKELNAELDRLKVTDKERLGETVEEVETVEEATKADDEHGTAKRVDRITKFLKKYPDPSKLKAHHLDNFFNHPDYFGETDAASDAAMKKLTVQHRKQLRAMRKDYDDRNW